MDALAASLGDLAPLEGFERASYTGGIEDEREPGFREHGIPVGPEHRRDLDDIAVEFGVDVPWPKSTRTTAFYPMPESGVICQATVTSRVIHRPWARADRGLSSSR